MRRRVRAELRRDIRKVLSNLDDRWLRAASAEICLNLSGFLAESEASESSCLLAWKNFFPGEIDLSSLIEEQLRKRRVFLPRSDELGRMSFIELRQSWRDDLEPGPFGIPEPKLGSGAVYESGLASHSSILVPGLVFDNAGNRLGRGGGFYDRFLGHGPYQRARKIGIGLSLQFVEAIPIEDHDIEMNWLCSERGVFKAAES